MDRSRTLAQLEGDDWGAPDYDSYLVRECHRLRHVPTEDLTVEDLRLLIGQKISLGYLIPLAIDHLLRDPLVSGDMYPGDLLVAVQSVPEEFWREHPSLLSQWQAVRKHAF